VKSGHKYLVKNPKLLAALRLAEAVSRALALFGRQPDRQVRPRRILLANIAHIGDVLIATSILPPLRQAFPDVEIGMLVGSWCRNVVEGHPDIAHVHVLDNAVLNRAAPSGRHRLLRHARSWFAARAEIRALGYDTAIDLYFHWPNSIPLIWAAGIPRRIGYDCGGFGPLLTDAFPWRDEPRHVAQSQCALLRALGLDQPETAPPRMSLPPLAPTDWDHLPGNLRAGSYIILHPGTGDPDKEWPVTHWIALAQRLAAEGQRLALTGRGPREAAIIAEIGTAVPSAVNLCDALSWVQLRQVIKDARLLVGVDSMAAHLAAASATPFVGLFSGQARLTWWRPLGDGAILTDGGSPRGGEGGTGPGDISRIRPETAYQACRDRLTQPAI